MPRLTTNATLARAAPWANAGLLLLAVVVTALLAYRAHEAAQAHRATAEQTLREYAAFAAFELKNATLNRVATQHRVVMDPVLRSSATRPRSPLPIGHVAELVQTQSTLCECLGGVEFFYSLTFDDSALAATPSPLAHARALDALRDTIIVYASAVSRRGDRVAPPSEAGATNASPGIPVTAAFYLPIPGRIDGRRLLFASSLTLDVFGRPLNVYGFATDPEPYVGAAIRAVIRSQPLLPATLTRNIPIDSILAVRVLDLDGELVFQNKSSFDSRYGATDSLEARHGGLRFDVAINPSVADRLIIGGLPRSRLPVLIGLFALAAALLVLMLFQLRRQQELVRLRSEFVSGVSHELRTPLAQIRVLAELLRLGKIPTEERRERSLRIIDQEARRLTFLVESILNFSTLDRQNVVPVMIDVAAEVEEIVAGFEPLASAHRVRLETQLERGLVVNVDRAAIRQVLLNLLDNAVRYGPEGQTVRVSSASDNGTWRLVVEDQGTGIPIAERERIFEPYYRLERDARGEKGGSGIGLAVVRGLVEKHGGTVAVDGPSDVPGSRFVVELPATGPRHEEGA